MCSTAGHTHTHTHTPPCSDPRTWSLKIFVKLGVSERLFNNCCECCNSTGAFPGSVFGFLPPQPGNNVCMFGVNARLDSTELRSDLPRMLSGFDPFSDHVGDLGVLESEVGSDHEELKVRVFSGFRL